MSGKKLPRNSRPMRRDGSPKKLIGFKAPEAMRLFVEQRADAESVGLSDIVRDGAVLYKELFEKLGAEWFEIRRRAGVAGVSFGSIVASLTRAALEYERRNNNTRK